METKTLTEAEARDFLDLCGDAIGHRLDTLYQDALDEYRTEGIDNPTVAVHAYSVWEITQQVVDERGMVAVGELRDGDATAVLMMSPDGTMDVVYQPRPTRMETTMETTTRTYCFAIARGGMKRYETQEGTDPPGAVRPILDHYRVRGFREGASTDAATGLWSLVHPSFTDRVLIVLQD